MVAGTEGQLAVADVAGVRRKVNIGLLEDEVLEVGDWVLIHVGFAMSKIDEEEAALALASLKMMGGIFDEEVEALMTSQSAAEEMPDAVKAWED